MARSNSKSQQLQDYVVDLPPRVPSHNSQKGYPPQDGYYPQEQGEDPELGDDVPQPPPESYLYQVQFTETAIRNAFIRKVYAILMVQLAVTAGFIALFVLEESVKTWAYQNPGVFYAAIVLSFTLLIALVCCESVRRQTPGNFICLAVFTIAEGFLLGMFSSSFNANAVLLAVLITAIICLSLTIFSFQTKWDATGMGSALLIAAIVLIIFGFVAGFLRSTFPILHIVYSAFGALLFSFYLIYDTQLMMGGNHKYSISPEEYIFAALNLYLDIVNIFIYILSLLRSR